MNRPPEMRAHLRAAQALLLIFIVTGLTSFIANVYGRHHFDLHPAMLAIPSTIFSFLLFALAYIGYTLSTRPQIITVTAEADPLDYDNIIDNPPANFNLPPAQGKRLARLIVNTLRKEKLYLSADFKIADLAARMNTNRKYINQAVNGTLNVTFNDLINRMRIEHAVELLVADPEHPINLIAEASGYQSLATFYRNFRSILGCTPKEYLVRLAQNCSTTTIIADTIADFNEDHESSDNLINPEASDNSEISETSEDPNPEK